MRPYGLVGLVLSLVAVLAVAGLLCASAGLAAYIVAGLTLGWHAALSRLIDLKDAARSETEFQQRLQIVVSLVLYAAFIASVLIAARFRGGRQWRELVAWRPWRPWRGARRFWLITLATIIYSLGADALVSRLYPASSDWVSLPVGPTWIGLFAVLAIVFAPAAEEILFRGWLYTALRQAIGIWPGVLISAALFALAHWEHTHLYAAAVFPVGVALAYVRERTGSIKASMTLHAVYNGAATVLLLASR